MIGPKRPKPSKADETTAYELATLRDNATCQKCHGPGDVQRDHIQNRDRFNTVVSNLRCLCLPCHAWKTEHPETANETGWGCPRWANPSEWPGKRRVSGVFEWVFFDDIGGWEVITEAQAKAARSGFGIIF